jgi:hypothetical protein
MISISYIIEFQGWKKFAGLERFIIMSGFFSSCQIPLLSLMVSSEDSYTFGWACSTEKGRGRWPLCQTEKIG